MFFKLGSVIDLENTIVPSPHSVRPVRSPLICAETTGIKQYIIIKYDNDKHIDNNNTTNNNNINNTKIIYIYIYKYIIIILIKTNFYTNAGGTKAEILKKSIEIYFKIINRANFYTNARGTKVEIKLSTNNQTTNHTLFWHE